ncbi:hypothetical protein YN1_8080 [Nanoarchaeota archaeon]
MDLKKAKSLKDLGYEYSELDFILNYVTEIFHDKEKRTDQNFVYMYRKIFNMRKKNKKTGFFDIFAKNNSKLKNEPISLEEIIEFLRYRILSDLMDILRASEDGSGDLEEWIKNTSLIDMARRSALSLYLVYYYIGNEYKEKLNNIYYNLLENLDIKDENVSSNNLSIPRSIKETAELIYMIYKNDQRISSYAKTLSKIYDRLSESYKKYIDEIYKYVKKLVFKNIENYYKS